MTRRALAFTAYLIAATAALVASGCVCEDYYCDESGCYFCDGIGCRAVDPPERPTCRGNYECPDGQRCTSLGCTDSCTDDGECPQGTHCDDGLCVNPTEPDPEPKPGTCSRNDDCMASGVICLDGLCVDEPTMSPACTENDDCGDDQVCQDGECIAETAACQFNYECGDGHICADGKCTTECDDARPCAAGLACEAGICVEAPTPGQCTNNAACGDGKVCIDSSCFDACTDDASCGEGRYCDAGVCRIDQRPTPFCTDNSMCREGHECVDNICRTPCDTDMQCLRFDVQFTVCKAFDTGRFCVTTSEATAECITTVDCEGDRNCIDGVCR